MMEEEECDTEGGEGMSNKGQPTQEQLKRFWEWCGFQFWQPVEGGAIDVLDPDGSFYLSPSKLAIPSLDLNNLFKHAVPRATKDGFTVELEASNKSEIYWAMAIDYRNLPEEVYWSDSKDPALALFWAIWEAMEAENEKV